MKMQMVFGKLLLELILILDYALVHEQKQHFISWREKSDRGREVGMEGEGSGGGRERGGKVGIRYPCPPPPCRCAIKNEIKVY